MDRSSSPAVMRNVKATATMPTKAVCWMISTRLWALRNAGAAAEKKANSTTATTAIADWRPMTRFSARCDMRSRSGPPSDGAVAWPLIAPTRWTSASR